MTHNEPNNAVPSADSAATRSPSHNSEHLANERTFLAWIRTSISVIGLGFVVAKFSVWLRELTMRLGELPLEHHAGLSLPLGVGMMSAGGALALIASWRYRRVRRAIETGGSAADSRTMTAVTLVVFGISAALVAYMLAARQ